MICRIKNAVMVKAREVWVVRNKLTLSVAKLLKEEGFIDSFEECGDVYMTKKGLIYKHICISLKYKGVKQKPYITNLKRVSKPGLRVYTNYKNAPKVLGGIGVAVFAFCC